MEIESYGGGADITAVEYDPKIASIYKDFFPNDKVIVGDAHQYLLDNFKEFDFIWSSPPCPSHSDIRSNIGVSSGQVKAIYPDMTLYQEIIFLKKFYKGKFCVENVIAYYKALIPPQEICNHWFWTNFFIPDFPEGIRNHHSRMEMIQESKGFNLDKYSGIDKRKILRNCVNPYLAKHIFDSQHGALHQKLFN